MKKRYCLFSVILLALFAAGCEESQPDTTYSYYVVRNGVQYDNPTEVAVNEKIVFKATGDGSVFAIWPGDSLHKYDKRNVVIETDTLQKFRNVGLAMSKVSGGYGTDYSYLMRGQYNLTLVARVVDNFGATITEKVESTKSIKVIDSSSSIISAKVDSWYWAADSAKKGKQIIDLNYSCKISGDSVIAFVDSFFFDNKKPRILQCSFDCGNATAVSDNKTLSGKNAIPFSKFPLGIVVTSQEGNSRKYVMYLKQAVK